MTRVGPLADIFPPGLPLLHGPELTAALAEWAAERIADVGPQGFGPCWAVGIVRGGTLAAVVVFHSYDPHAGTAQVSIAADTPKWASRQVIGAILGVAFCGRLGAPVRKVWVMVAHTNARALRCVKRIGFVREAVLREQMAARTHGVIWGMMAREWHRRYGGLHG
jgi:RimJ/RimL family protein N-acetyltransferase